MATLLLAGCRNGEETADAYGNFEATEVIVSAETSGRILQFSPTEGSEVEEGEEIALVDTTFFHLQKARIGGQPGEHPHPPPYPRCPEWYPAATGFQPEPRNWQDGEAAPR